jgi:hypothetical protein
MPVLASARRSRGEVILMHCPLAGRAPPSLNPPARIGSAFPCSRWVHEGKRAGARSGGFCCECCAQLREDGVATAIPTANSNTEEGGRPICDVSSICYGKLGSSNVSL